MAVLEPFMSIQKMLEGQKYVNISLIPYLVFKVRNHLENSITEFSAAGQNSSILELLKKMRFDFRERWGIGTPGSVFSEHEQEGYRRHRKGLPLLTMQAALLDPRTKSGVGLGDPQTDQEQVVFYYYYYYYYFIERTLDELRRSVIYIYIYILCFLPSAFFFRIYTFYVLDLGKYN